MDGRMVPGHRVRFKLKDRETVGTVKYVGPIDSEKYDGEWVGVEVQDVDRHREGNAGIINNIRYFRCVPGRGVFLRAQSVTPEPATATSGEVRMSYLRQQLIEAAEKKHWSLLKDIVVEAQRHGGVPKQEILAAQRLLKLESGDYPIGDRASLVLPTYAEEPPPITTSPQHSESVMKVKTRSRTGGASSPGMSVTGSGGRTVRQLNVGHSARSDTSNKGSTPQPNSARSNGSTEPGGGGLISSASVAAAAAQAAAAHAKLTEDASAEIIQRLSQRVTKLESRVRSLEGKAPAQLGTQQPAAGSETSSPRGGNAAGLKNFSVIMSDAAQGMEARMQQHEAALKVLSNSIEHATSQLLGRDADRRVTLTEGRDADRRVTFIEGRLDALWGILQGERLMPSAGTETKQGGAASRVQTGDDSPTKGGRGRGTAPEMAMSQETLASTFRKYSELPPMPVNRLEDFFSDLGFDVQDLPKMKKTLGGERTGKIEFQDLLNALEKV